MEALEMLTAQAIDARIALHTLWTVSHCVPEWLCQAAGSSFSERPTLLQFSRQRTVDRAGSGYETEGGSHKAR